MGARFYALAHGSGRGGTVAPLSRRPYSPKQRGSPTSHSPAHVGPNVQWAGEAGSLHEFETLSGSSFGWETSDPRGVLPDSGWAAAVGVSRLPCRLRRSWRMTPPPD